MTKHEYVPVEDVMTREAQIIDGMATVREAVAKMEERGVSSLIIERRNPHDEYGLLVIADIARKVISVNLSPDRVQVYEIMSKPVLTLPAEMNIKYAIRHLVEFDRGRGLVVDHERQLVGIVTLRDMVLRYAKSDL